jgi:hypothetical protein
MHRTNGEGNVAGQFVGGPPATCLTPEWCNSVQEELCNVIEAAGLTVASDGFADTKNQLLAAIQTIISNTDPYDIIVSTQAEFNALFTRQGANHYHIHDDYKTVLVKNFTGGYLCDGPMSFLSGGDTWGYVQTNLCTHLKFENGAYWNVGDSLFYLEANTDDCKLENVWIRGLGTVAAALTRSFYATGLRMTFDNCKTSNRYANATFVGFEGSNVVATDITNKYINCLASYLITTVGLVSGFRYCYNVSNCISYNISSITVGIDVYGFFSCNNMSNCIAYNISGTTSFVSGFSTCNFLSSCYSESISCSSGGADGFRACSNMSSCYANTIDSTAAGWAIGFNGCNYISSCKANDIDSAGGNANGFRSCNYGSSLYTNEAANTSNDWMNTNDAQITNKYSVPAVFT